MKSVYTYETIETTTNTAGISQYCIDGFKTRAKNRVRGLLNNGVVIQGDGEIRIKAIAVDKNFQVLYITRDELGDYSAHEAMSRNSDFTEVTVYRHARYSAPTLPELEQAMGALLVTRLSSVALERNNNLRDAGRGVAHAAAAVGYRSSAKDCADLASDIASGKRSSGNKGVDIALAILLGAGAGINTIAAGEELQQAADAFGRIRW